MMNAETLRLREMLKQEFITSLFSPQLGVSAFIICFCLTAQAAPPATVPSTGPAFEATTLSLDVRNANLAETLAKVFGDSGVLFEPPPDFILPRKANNVTVKLDREPYWLGLRKLLQSADLELNGGNGGAVSVTRADTPWNNPAFTSGPFLVIAHSIHRGSTVHLGLPDKPVSSFNIELLLLADPKLRAYGHRRGADVTEAVDENGLSLAPVPPKKPEPFYANDEYGYAFWKVNVPLAYPAGAGKRIARLRGVAHFLVQTAATTWDVPDVLAAKETSITVGRIRYTFRGVKRDGDNAAVRFTVEAGEETTPEQWKQVMKNWSDTERTKQMLRFATRLLDEKGNAMRPLDISDAREGDRLNYTLHLTANAPNGSQTGKPVRMVVELPEKLEEMAVPFEFTDLTIP